MTSKFITVMATAGLLLAPSLDAIAQGLQGVRPLPGYICMSLTQKDMQATSESQLPPVFSAPSASAERLGYAPGIAFVKWPMDEKNGFVEIIRFNRQIAWIAAKELRPWRSASGRPATCIPTVMSNGSIGIDIH